MTLDEVLNSELDLGGLGRLARQGLDWWLGQLASIAPASWREAFSSQPKILAEHLCDGRWRLWRGGRRLSEGLSVGEAKGSVGLLLDPAAVLIRQLTVPRMSGTDVRRMLALDIDRHSPLREELIHFDIEVLDAGAADRPQTVLLGIVPRTTAAEILTAARAAGLSAQRLSVRPGGATEAAHFDFLPAALAGSGAETTSSRRAWLWGAIAALFALNLAVLVGRDMIGVDDLRRQVEAQQPAASAALRLRSRVENEAARRRALIARGLRADPLAMLNALSDALPGDSWVQRLEWNGHTLHLTGYKSAGIDIEAAVRGSGAFENARAGEATQGKGPGEPYDVTADARVKP